MRSATPSRTCQEAPLDDSRIPDTDLDVVPLANARPREDGLAALEKRPNGRERRKPVNAPEFVQRLEHSVIEEPMFLVLVRWHLRTSAPDLLGKCFISGLQDP